jgi:exportin-1
VFDFSSGQMTQTKAKHLKESMCNEFQQVFQLCTFIMSNSQNTSLINVTLETLLRFLNWIPLGYIFETELIPHLIETFLVMPLFRNVTLKCLTEIVSINVSTYDEKFVLLYNMTMTRIKEVNFKI